MKDVLVSIVLITYNSENYIVETLESVKNQIYGNLELIISDDASTDKTIQVIDDWLLSNKNRFSNIVFIKGEHNVGVTRNLSRALKIASGKWIKGVAGDDILMPNCICDYIKFIEQSTEELYVLHSNCCLINDDSSFLSLTPKINVLAKNNSLSQLDQKRLFYNHIVFDQITLFYRKDALETICYLDEEFIMNEDTALIYRLINAGYYFTYVPIFTMYYRMSLNSLSNNRTQLVQKYLLDVLSVRRKYVYPHLNIWGKLFERYYSLIINYWFNSKNNNKYVMLYRMSIFPYSIKIRLFELVLKFKY